MDNKRALGLIGLAFFLAAPSALSAQQPSCEGEIKPYVQFGINIEQSAIVTRTNPLRTVFSDLPARYIRLKLQARAAQDNWQLIIRDPSFRPIAYVNPSDFPRRTGAQQDYQPIWTGRLEASNVHLDLKFTSPEDNARIAVLDAIVMPEKIANPFYSWKGDSADYKELYAVEGDNDDETRDLRRLGDGVGMLIANGPDDEGKTANWCCSGVLLSSTLFLTNWHCGAGRNITETSRSSFWHSSVCDSAVVDFSWDGDTHGAEYGCAAVEAKDEKLDYALLKVSPTDQSIVKMDRLPPIEVAPNPTANAPITLVHHAECRQKLLSRSCSVLSTTMPGWRGGAKEIGHDCDTAGGSSGAPLFIDGKLAGIHHLGHEEISGTCDKKNKAIPIADILDDIQKKNKKAYDELTIHRR